MLTNINCFVYVYINASSGEPISSPRFFQLSNQIKLENPNAPENQSFLNGIDSYKNRAKVSLDSCRDDSSVVWEAFRRQALIEIAQAQDQKIEEVKATCLDTMKECYDTVSGGIKNIDTTTAQAAGALGTRAAAAMCADKVSACANLYNTNPDSTCMAPTSTNLVANKGSSSNICGLPELIAFVETVDNVKIAEGCQTALENYAKELCSPSASDTNPYPWKCRLRTKAELEILFHSRAELYCGVKSSEWDATPASPPTAAAANSNDSRRINAPKATPLTTTTNSALLSDIKEKVNNLLDDINYLLYTQLESTCTGLEGIWRTTTEAGYEELQEFNQMVYGDNIGRSRGYCFKNAGKIACDDQNVLTGNQGYAVYNSSKGTCDLLDGWYKVRCESMETAGYWDKTAQICYF